MAIDALKLVECRNLSREARVRLDDLELGLKFMERVECVSGIVPELVDTLKGQSDAVKDLVDNLKDRLDELVP